MTDTAAHSTVELPLCGLRVLECAGTVGGAYAGRLLSDLGADVVLVEGPAGDPLRRRGPFCAAPGGRSWSAAVAALHAGKRSVTAADDGTGDALVEALARQADVLLRNPGPGARLVDDALVARAEAANPGLVVADLTAYGRTGPYAGGDDPDLVVSARSGILSITSTVGAASTFAGPPSPLRYAGEAAWVFGGCHLAVAVLGALHARLHHGLGQRVDVSAMESVVAVLATAVPTFTYTGKVAKHDAPKIVRPWAIYELADGEVSIQCTEDAQWRALARVLERQDWLDRADWATTDGRIADSDAVEAAVAAELRSRPTGVFLAGAHAAGVPATVVQTNAEVLAWPQLTGREFFVPATVEGGDGGPIVAPRSPLRFGRRPLPRAASAPRLGAHGAAVLDEWASTPPRTFAPTSPGRTDIAPLDGVRIADLTWVWAGPFSTMQLAHLGADVVKVESHTRVDVVRRLPPYADGEPGVDRSGYFHQYNQGKRGTDLDLTTTADRATFEALVATADLVVDNMRAGALSRMGYDDERLAALNPRLIVSSITGFGDAGPDRDRTAYGAIINCLSGVAAITGRPGGGPVDLQLSLADPCAGLHAAIGMLAALYRRRTTGVVERVDCTMVEAWIAAFPWGVLNEACGGSPRAVGNRDERWCPNVVARCTGDDEWVAVSVLDDDQWVRLSGAIGRPALATDERFATAEARLADVDGTEAVVATWAAERDAHDAADLLRAAGVPAARVARLDDVLADEHLAARGFFTDLEHPVVGRRRLAGVPFHASRSPLGPRRPAPCLGEHTAEVRAELGEPSPS